MVSDEPSKHFHRVYLIILIKMLANFRRKCLLVSSDTTHPSGSIPPINLAQEVGVEGRPPSSRSLQEESVEEEMRADLVRLPQSLQEERIHRELF